MNKLVIELVNMSVIALVTSQNRPYSDHEFMMSILIPKCHDSTTIYLATACCHIMPYLNFGSKLRAQYVGPIQFFIHRHIQKSPLFSVQSAMPIVLAAHPSLIVYNFVVTTPYLHLSCVVILVTQDCIMDAWSTLLALYQKGNY